MSELTYTALGLALVGVIFCGAYAVNGERLWWAIIPGIGAFTLLAALVADVVVGTDPANDWASVLVISAGAALTAVLLSRPNAQLVLAIVAGFALAIAILMMPLTLTAKLVSIAVIAAVAALVVWERRRHWADLRPH